MLSQWCHPHSLILYYIVVRDDEIFKIIPVSQDFQKRLLSTIQKLLINKDDRNQTTIKFEVHEKHFKSVLHTFICTLKCGNDFLLKIPAFWIWFQFYNMCLCFAVSLTEIPGENLSLNVFKCRYSKLSVFSLSSHATRLHS